MTHGGTSDSRPWWRRPIGVEVLLNALAIVVLPLAARLGYSWLERPLRGIGMASLADAISGSPSWTDIGWEVAAARGLAENGFSPYDAMGTLAHLIGMASYPAGVHTHPPTSFIPFVPLGFIPYEWWLPFFVVASACMIAWSMRLMRVPAWVAYGLAILVVVTPLGTFAAASTYPLMAFLLALAWRYRERPWVAGVSYALLATSRGVAALMLVYPAMRRQWRTVAVAVGVIGVIAVTALILQPDVFGDFLDRGRAAIADHSARGDLFSPSAVLERHGIPGWLAYLALLIAAGVALYRRQSLFWTLAWLSIVISPIAWGQSVVIAIPLLVVFWFSGRIGQGIVVITGAVTFAVLVQSPAGPNSAWLLMVVMTTIGILACPLSDDSIRERHKQVPV